MSTSTRLGLITLLIALLFALCACDGEGEGTPIPGRSWFDGPNSVQVTATPRPSHWPTATPMPALIERNSVDPNKWN